MQRGEYLPLRSLTPLLNQSEQCLLDILQFRNLVVIKTGPVVAFLKVLDELVDASKAAVDLFISIDFDLAQCLLQFTSSCQLTQVWVAKRADAF